MVIGAAPAALRGTTVREWLARPSTVVAIALVVLGLGFVGLVAQSPNRLYWVGERVTGTIDGGIAYYRVDGEEYSLDDTGSPRPDGTRVTVYVDHDEPSEALLRRPVMWVEGGAILSCFAAALLVLLLAPVRRNLRSRHRSPDLRVDAHW
jgi:hypothetical protein